MFAYIVRRLLLIIPTLFATMVINFTIIQIAPGGPVEQAIAELTGSAVGPRRASPAPAPARWARPGSST